MWLAFGGSDDDDVVYIWALCGRGIREGGKGSVTRVASG